MLNSPSRFVMGHELYGEIVALGSSFIENSSTANGEASKRPLGYSSYKVGQKVRHIVPNLPYLTYTYKVIAAFSVSCLECEYVNILMTLNDMSHQNL
jgi:hypothetical protein